MMKSNDIIKLIQTHLENYWLTLPRMSGHRTETAVYLDSNVQDAIMNSVLNFHPPKDNLDTAIQEIMAYYQSKQLPFCWWTAPGITTDGLGEKLISQGFSRTMDVKGMAMNIGKFQWDGFFPEDITVIEMVSPKQFVDWISVIRTACGMNPQAANLYKDMMAMQRKQSDVLPCYLAYYKGRPISTYSVFFDQDSACLYNVSTLPEFRKKHIASAMSAFCLNIAQQRKCEWVTLQASPNSARLFERLGFKSYIDYRLYFKG